MQLNEREENWNLGRQKSCQHAKHEKLRLELLQSDSVNLLYIQALAIDLGSRQSNFNSSKMSSPCHQMVDFLVDGKFPIS